MPRHDPQHDHTLPRPLPQAGACTPTARSSPPFRLHVSQTPQTQSVRNWTHRPTNLLLLQGSLLSKGTTVYQVMHTRNLRAALDSTLLPLCYLLFHFPNLLCVHLSLPSPRAPAPSPPTLQLHFSPVIPVLWPPTSSFYMPCSFLRRAFAHANALCAASLPGFLFCPFGALVPIVILG